MSRKKAQRSKGGGYVYQPKSNGKIISHIYRARWVKDGKVYTRTTGTSDKREAEKVLADLVHPFAAETKEKRESEMLARLQGTRAEIQAWKDAQPALGIKAAFTAYRKSQSRPNRGNDDTLDRYEGQYLEFAKWLAVHHPNVQELRHVTQDMAEGFAAEIKATRSANTFNKRITLYRSIWEHLAQSARLTLNPWKTIRKMELETHTRRELTIDELRRVCEPLEGEMRLLFAVGIYTGLRLGDCCRLDWGCVDLVRGLITIEPHKTKKHTKGKPVIIPIHPTLAGMLAEIPKCERRGYVVPEIAETFAHDPTVISRRIQKIFEDAGIKTHGENSISGRAQIDVGFHSLRHTFVSMAANAGASLALVQSIIGHSNPAMTRHYFHESVSALKTTVASLPSISGELPPPGTTNAAEARYRRFCDTVDGMTADELKRASDEIARRLAEMI